MSDQNRDSLNSPPNEPTQHGGSLTYVANEFSTWFERSHISTNADRQFFAKSDEELIERDLCDLSLDGLAEVYNCLNLLEDVWPTESNDPPSEKIGPYRLITKLGSGGMGEVWSAEQTEPIERNLAIKLIRQGALSNAARARFISERRLLAQLEHPNIARIIEAGESEQGQLYFAMELVDGTTINKYCTANKLTLSQRLRIVIDACSGVQHAHRKGIVHRDLKPSNILVTVIDGQPVPKVIDFGLAKLAEDANETIKSTSQTNDQKTQFGDVLGTIEFMSPEQAAGDHEKVDTRSDVYSLGVLLYSLITGNTPVKLSAAKGDSKDKVLQRIVDGTARPPSEVVYQNENNNSLLSDGGAGKRKLVRSLRNDLDWVVMKALAKSPDDRYPTIESLAGDLNRILNHEPVTARPYSFRYWLGKFLGRNFFTAAATALVFLCLLGGVIGTTTGWISSAKARKLAESNLKQARLSNEVLGNIFSDLDIKSVEQSEKPVKMLFAQRLKKAGQQIVDGSEDDPVEVAGTLLKLSKALNALGFPKDAVPICKHAVELAEDQQGPFGQLAREIKRVLADSYIGLGQYEKCQDTLNPLLEFCRDELGPSDEETIQTIELLAKMKTTEGDQVSALEWYQQAHSIREKESVGSRTELMNAAMGIAECLLRSQRHSDAIPILEEVLAFRRTELAAGHPDTIRAIAVLSFALEMSPNRKVRQRAAELTEEAFQLSTKTYGKHHRETYWVQSLHAGNLAMRRKFEEALDSLAEAYEGLTEICGDEHTHTMTARRMMFLTYSDVGNYHKAIELAQFNSQINSRQFAEGHPARVYEFISLAQLFISVEEFEQAHQQLALAMNGTVSQGSRLRVAWHVGDAFRAARDFEAALDCLRAAVTEMDSGAVDFGREGIAAKICLASALTGAGEFDEAIELLDATKDSIAERNPGSGFIPVLLAHKGIAFSQSGDHRKGIELMEAFVRSGQEFQNPGRLYINLHDAYAAVDDVERISASLARIEKRIRKGYAPNSIFLARKLRLVWEESIRFERWESANKLLVDSRRIWQSEEPGSWDALLVEFQLALVELGLASQSEHTDAENSDTETESSNGTKELQIQLVLERLRRLHEELETRNGETFQIDLNQLKQNIGKLADVLEDLEMPKEAERWRLLNTAP